MTPSCPLCSSSVEAEALESHLRLELGLPALKCLLCRELFADRSDASDHFQGPLAFHPGVDAQLMRVPSSEAEKAQLVELLRLARGGAEEVERRLCVCGRCRLACRDPAGLDLRDPFRPVAAALNDFHRSSGGEGLAPAPGPASPSVDDKPIMDAPLAQPSQSGGIREESEEDWTEEEQNHSSPSHTGTVSKKPSQSNETLADERKADLRGSGKALCVRCSVSVERNSVSFHVQKHHMPGRPFHCLICSGEFKLRLELARHQKLEHGTELSEDTFTSALTKDAVRDWIRICFGELRHVAYKSLRCRECQRDVRQQEAKTHVAEVHLRKPLFRCRLCDYVSHSANAGRMNDHVRRVHRQAAGRETVDGQGMAAHAHLLKALLADLFAKG